MTDETDTVARETGTGGTDAPANRRGSGSRGRRGARAGAFRPTPFGVRWSVGVPVAILVAVILVAGGDLALSAGRVHPRVSISGVAVGGLTHAEAESRLRTEVAARLVRPVEARFEADRWKVTAAEVGAKVDAARSADRAFAVGREGGFMASAGQRLQALVAGVGLPAVMTGDATKLSALFDEMDDKIATDPVDADVTIKGLEPSLVPSRAGRRLRRAVVARDLLEAFAAGKGEVRPAIEILPARLSDADAQQALADARTMLSGPAVVKWESKSWMFAPAVIAAWMEFRSVSATSVGDPSVATTSSAPSGSKAASSGRADRLVLQAGLDSAEMSATLLPLLGAIGRPAVEAKFVVEGGRVTVSGGQVGLGPDFVSVAADLGKALRGAAERSATLKLTTVEPFLTAQKARDMGILERISTFTTTYSAGAKDRVNNVHTLADALNDKLVPPGGTFDFNATVGERTAAKGYREAPAIVNGKLVPQLGGGICQIGTTFFNAVFFSGLPVVERKNHSFYISHYPTGRDCTVTWGGPNLRWRNDTATWILIKTSYTNSTVTISLYGTNPGYSVAYTTSAFENIRPHPIVEVKDPTLPIGARVVEDGGVDGAKVTVVRTVTKNGQVVRTDTFLSLYKPKEETVRVGTRAGSVTTSRTP